MTNVTHIQFHIGDFLSGVMHMDGSEVGAYTMLIMAHYQAGIQGIPDDDKKLRQICKITTRSWPKIKETILEKFYLEDGCWKHHRIIEELEKIRSKAGPGRGKTSDKKQSEEALNDFQKTDKGNTKKNKSLKNNDTEKTNHNPVTNSKKGITKVIPKKTTPVPKPDDVPQNLWDDHLSVRKAKRQPMTATALAQMRREADKLSWTLEQALQESCGRGWASFKASWVENDVKNGGTHDKRFDRSAETLFAGFSEADC